MSSRRTHAEGRSLYSYTYLEAARRALTRAAVIGWSVDEVEAFGEQLLEEGRDLRTVEDHITERLEADVATAVEIAEEVQQRDEPASPSRR